MTLNNIVSFENRELEIRVKVDKINDTVWLSQKDMANLFGCFTDNIGLHLKNILNVESLTEIQLPRIPCQLLVMVNDIMLKSTIWMQ